MRQDRAQTGGRRLAVGCATVGAVVATVSVLTNQAFAAERPTVTGSVHLGHHATKHHATKHLVCAGSVTVELSPAVTLVPVRVSGSGVGTLDDCYSPDHTQTALKSATVRFSGSGTASCAHPSTGTGTAEITWYARSGRRGPVVGTTTLVSQGPQTVRAGLLSSTAAMSAIGVASPGSTVLANQRGRVSGTADVDVLTCATAGVHEASGTIVVDF